MTDEPDTPAWRRDHGEYPGWQVALSFALGALFLFAGVIGMVALPVSLSRTHRFVREAAHVEAPIVDFAPGASDTGHAIPGYRPIVAIADRAGRPVRVAVGEADYRDTRAIGTRIAILYRPGAEAGAVRDDVDGIWGDTLAIGVLGGAALFMGIVILAWMRFFGRYGPEHLTWLDRHFGPLKLASWLLG